MPQGVLGGLGVTVFLYTLSSLIITGMVPISVRFSYLLSSLSNWKY